MVSFERSIFLLIAVCNVIACVADVYAQCSPESGQCCYSAPRCPAPEDQDGCINVDGPDNTVVVVKISTWHSRSICTGEYANGYDICALDQDEATKVTCAEGAYYQSKADCDANVNVLGNVAYVSNVCCGSTTCSVVV